MTIAIDDYAAVLFHGAAVERVVSWRHGSSAYRVIAEDGQVQEVAYRAEWIVHAEANTPSVNPNKRGSRNRPDGVLGRCMSEKPTRPLTADQAK